MECSYHHNAYFAQIVGEVVRREKNESFPDYVQLIFDNQDSKLLAVIHSFGRKPRYF